MEEEKFVKIDKINFRGQLDTIHLRWPTDPESNVYGIIIDDVDFCPRCATGVRSTHSSVQSNRLMIHSPCARK
jgi:hypothetical protein